MAPIANVCILLREALTTAQLRSKPSSPGESDLATCFTRRIVDVGARENGGAVKSDGGMPAVDSYRAVSTRARACRFDATGTPHMGPP